MTVNDSTRLAPTVAVVTVSFGSEDVLPQFLESTRAASLGPLYVVVADNKSGQDPELEALVATAGAHYLSMPGNLGYGGAVNEAVRHLPESIIWIVVANPDLVMASGSVDTLIEVAREDERIASVGPATLSSSGDLYPSARSIPSLRTGVGHALFLNLWPSNPWSRAYRNETSGEPVRRDTGWLSGACLLVRRSAFEQIGGFDAGFFMYFEDVDLGFRFGRAGYRNVYEPAAVVTHTGAHSTNSDPALMIDAHHRSAERFLGKKYSRRSLWPVRVVLRAGLRLRSAIVRRNLDR